MGKKSYNYANLVNKVVAYISPIPLQLTNQTVRQEKKLTRELCELVFDTTIKDCD